MDPITLALMGSGLLGGFLGGRGKKTIDPQLLARLFGPQALATDTQSLFNTLLNSPQFQLMQSQASAAGTSAGNATRANFARAGLSGSGVGALGSAVAGGFGQNLMLGARSSLWGNALQAAQANLAGRMNIFGQSALNSQGQPTMAQSFGNALTGAASMGLSAMGARKPRNDSSSLYASGAYTPIVSTNVVSAPMRRVGPSTVLNSTDPFDRRLNVQY